MVAVLDEQFSTLNGFVARWSLETEAERFANRVNGGFGETKQFYETMLPRMSEIIEHLNATSMAEFSDRQKALFHLAQSFFEAAIAVEMLGEPDEATMLAPERMRIDFAGGVFP